MGPPAQAAGGRQQASPTNVPPLSSNPQPQFQSADHAALLEETRSRIDELDALLVTLTNLSARATQLASKIDAASPQEVQALWQTASQTVAAYLNQHLQLVAGADPSTLIASVPILQGWIDHFRQGSVGAGGERLHDSPIRLERLLSKLVDLQPSVSELTTRASALLAGGSTNPAAVAAQAAALAARMMQTHDRLEAIDTLVTQLHNVAGPRVAALVGQIKTQSSALKSLADNAESSPTLTTSAREGLKALAAFAVEPLEEALTSIDAWVGKYRPDPSLTAEQVARRIHTELEAPLAALETQVSQLANQYQPKQLQAAEAARQTEQYQTLRDQVTSQLTAVKARYQALVAVRRRKLGSEPDDRYFGAIAKTVNDAITELGSYENELLALQADLGADHAVGAYAALRTRTLSLTETVSTLMKRTEEFADATHLEETLATAWKHELTPLAPLIDEARTRADFLRHELADTASHPGLTPSLTRHIQQLTEALGTAANQADRFSQNQTGVAASELPKLKQVVGELEQGLRSALRDTGKLADREGFRQFLGDELKHQQVAAAAKRTEEEVSEARERKALPGKIRALGTLRVTLLGRLRAVLGYATSIEPFDAARAGALYRTLDAVLTLSVDLPALEATTLEAVIRQTDRWEQFATSVEAGGHTVRAVELTVSQLELLFGPAGRLGETLTSLEKVASREPLRLYQRLARTRDRLGTQLERLTSELQLASASILMATDDDGSRVTNDPSRLGYRAEADTSRDDQELRRLGTELGRVRSLVLTAGQEPLGTQHALLVAIERALQTATEDLAAFQARLTTRAQAAKTTQVEDAATRHRLREKLQGLLREDRPDRSQELEVRPARNVAHSAAGGSQETTRSLPAGQAGFDLGDRDDTKIGDINVAVPDSDTPTVSVPIRRADADEQ